jgi:outer membrane lipoprotein carrier protein
MQDTGCRKRNPGFILHPAASCILYLLLTVHTALYALELPDVISGLQQRYASVETIRGSFQQTYRAPGIRREESGEFWLKKPGLMRWEYRSPEEQLFVADGKESFLYVPRDRQVTVQPFSAADLHSTPLRFLLGAGDISGSFFVSWEKEFKPSAQQTILVRLIPRRQESGYAFLVLELDVKTYDLRRIAIREPGGSTSEFFLSNIVTNTKLGKKLFQFKTPKGVEEMRLNSDQ